MKIGIYDLGDDSKAEWVFIYTFSHDATSEFDVSINGTDGMPDTWRDMVLELNSEDLTKDERIKIYECIFGEYDLSFSKWTFRTTWYSFIGTYYEWLEDVGRRMRATEYRVEQMFDRYLTERQEVYERKQPRCVDCKAIMEEEEHQKVLERERRLRERLPDPPDPDEGRRILEKVRARRTNA